MTTLQCDNDKRPAVQCAQHPKRPLLESSNAVETMMAMRLSWSCRRPRMRHQYPNPSTKPGVESCIKWHLLVKVQVWLVYSRLWFQTLLWFTMSLIDKWQFSVPDCLNFFIKTSMSLGCLIRVHVMFHQFSSTRPASKHLSLEAFQCRKVCWNRWWL